MRKAILLTIPTFIISFFSFSQEKEEELSRMLIDRMNELRTSNKLTPFERDEILDAAAFDQAEYILNAKKILHEQDNEKKKNVQKRVLYYEGFHADLGENAAMIDLGSKESVEPKGARVTINSEGLLLKAAINSWMEDKDVSKLNLLDPEFYKVGVSIIINNEKEYVIVAVFGSLPYKSPSGVEVDAKFHGVKPYNKEICKQLTTDHPTLPQLFSDAVLIEGNEIFLRYHNLALVQNILSSGSDGIAADVIQKKQFSCKEGNRLFPTEINDGYMLPPIRKGKLSVRNLLDSIGEVKVSLGTLPAFYDANTSEINLVIIKKDHHCTTVPFNTLETKNKKWFEMPFLIAGESDSSSFQWKDSIVLNYNSTEDWQTQFKKDYAALKRFNYQLESLRVLDQRSPIAELNKNLDSASFSFLEGEFSLEVEQNIAWDSLTNHIQGSYYQLDLANLDTMEKVDFLRKSIVEDEAMKKYLNGLNVLTIQLDGTGEIKGGIETKEALSSYELFLKSNNIAPALYLQAQLLEKVRKKELAASALPQADPSQKVKTLPIINNQIVLENIMGAKSYGGNPLYLAFFELYLINKSEVEVNFNYHIALLEHWSNHFADIKNFEGWLKDFKKIPPETIPKEKYAMALFNYYVLAIDYYYEKNNFDARKKAINDLMKWQSKAELTDSELLKLAQFLCFQDQFDKAIDVIKNKVNQEEVNKDLLFYFLQIAQYDGGDLDTKLVDKSFIKAQKQFPKEFCELFSKKKMGIQSLKNHIVKEAYCESCK